MRELRVMDYTQLEEMKLFFKEVFTKAPWNDDWSDEKYLLENDIQAIFLQTEHDIPAYYFYKKNGFYELKQQVSFAKRLK